MLSFINSFDFADDLSGLVGGSFATAGSASAGLQPTIEQLNRGLETFRVVVVGGDTWEAAEGVGAVTNKSVPFVNGTKEWEWAYGQGRRISSVAVSRLPSVCLSCLFHGHLETHTERLRSNPSITSHALQ